MKITAARLQDAPIPALTRTPDPRTGVLVMEYPLTWIGTRDYDGAQFGRPGERVRIAHLPEQVQAQAFVDSLGWLPAAVGHPWTTDEAGRVVSQWIHVDAGTGAALPPLGPGEEWVPPSEVAVGYLGEGVELRPIQGAHGEVTLPVGRIAVTSPQAKNLIQWGALESSLGYNALVVWEPGIYVAPDGSEHPYDGWHLLDTADPRAAGHPDAALLGPNHVAIAIWDGRGAEMSRALDQAPTGDLPCRFRLNRLEDVSGVSGTGIVAEGTLWTDGSVAVRWVTETPCTAIWDNLEALMAVHGHGGCTVVEWIDPPAGMPLVGWEMPPGEVEEGPEGPPKVEVEVEVEMSSGLDGQAPAYPGPVQSLHLPPRLAEAVRHRAADATLTLNVPDDKAAEAQVMLKHLEAAYAEMAQGMAQAQAQGEALTGQVEGLTSQNSQAAEQVTNLQKQLQDLQAQLAGTTDAAAAWRAHEMRVLEARAKSLRLRVQDGADKPADVDALKVILLRQVAPKGADAVIKAGPAAVSATLDGILAHMPTGLASPPKIDEIDLRGGDDTDDNEPRLFG